MAKSRELTLSEWCRNVLLAASISGNPALADLSPSAPPNTILLAEVLAVRMLVLNLLYPLGRGEPLTAEKIQSVTRQVDSEKLAMAIELMQGKPKSHN